MRRSKTLSAATLLTCLCIGALAIAQPALEQPSAQRVTVVAAAVPVREALAQLQRQTGMRLSVDPGLDGRVVTFNATDKPLWETLQALLTQVTQSDMPTFTIADDDAAPNRAGSWRISGRWCVSGPFLVVAQTITHEVDYRRKDSETEHYVIHLQLLADPTARIAMIGEARVDKAVDESGDAFALPSPDPNRRPGAPTPVRASLINRQSFVAPLPHQVVLVPATAASSRIQLVQGTIPATVFGQSETVEVPVPGTLEKDYASFHATFETVANPVGWTVNAAFVRAPAVSEEEWTRLRDQLESSKISLIDANGTPVASNGGGGGRGPDRVTRNSRFPGRGERARIEFATQSRSVDIPFHFENLPLR